MQNVKSLNALKIMQSVDTARFSKYVWPFFHIMLERVKVPPLYKN